MLLPSASPLEFAVGVLLDLIIGDPRRLPHPVQAIGGLIRFLERHFKRSGKRWRIRLAGGSLVAVTVSAPTASVVVILDLLPELWSSVLAVYLVFSLLALRSLDDQAGQVVSALRQGHVDNSRLLLSRIVGRDTERLESQGIMRAVIETVSENLCDAVIAPLFYLAVAGLPGMLAYKCINTLDSMIGYKDERYRDLGWAAARLDDCVNYVPARLSALFMLLAAPLAGLPAKQGWRTVGRDARKYNSPNAGYPEAAAAGLLGVRLGGPSNYRGQRVEKPFIGQGSPPADPSLYTPLRRLLYLSALLAYALTALGLALAA